MNGDILTSIANYKRQEVAARRAAARPGDLEDALRAAPPPRGFRCALQHGRTLGRLALIAEIKKASPSKGLIRHDFDPRALAVAYTAGGAAAISVLTDGPSFQGAESDLVVARSATTLPCLRKEFLIDPWQVAESLALGADAVLVILALVDDSLAAELISEAARLGMDALVETHDESQLRRAVRLGATLIGINNRDLRSFDTDLGVTERLALEIPATAFLVTESGIFTPADVRRLERAGVGAMLVGESLLRQGDVEAATRALLRPCPSSD